MTENRYEKHCPCTVSELREFRKLGEIEGAILEEVAAAKETLERNQWILTAEKSGLLRLAGMMGFFGAERMETEELREEILSRWCSRSPYTYFHLQDWLDGCVGAGNYTGTLERESYRLRLVLELCVKEKREFLQEASAENYSGKSGFAGEAECEYAWEAAQNAARRDEGKRADLRRDSL